MQIELVRPGGDPPDWLALEREWRTLEDAADCSLFQSWTWLGCRVAARFTDPWLLRATEAGRLVGLGLLNRTGPAFARTLRLHETGGRGEDSVFVEHSGPLLAHGHEALLRPMLALAARRGRLVLSGVDDTVLTAARSLGHCRVVATRQAPFAELDHLASGAEWLDQLGASTRYQLRRSRRSYEKAGCLEVQPARDLPEALAFLDAMARLHQARWTARGHPGAFAEPAFLAFHRELLARALPRGEVELLRISVNRPASPQILGYLYNLRWRDRIYAYQNGFDYAAAESHQLPGLTCHHLAIEAAILSQVRFYDFMAGESRYKTSLGKASRRIHWLELVHPGTPYDMLYRIRALLRPRRQKNRTLTDRHSLTAIRRIMGVKLYSRAAGKHPQLPAGRLAWPVAVVVIGALSLLAWVGLGYLLVWAFRG